MSNGFIERRQWGIVSCTEQSPGVKDENFPKFIARKDKELATIILTVQPSLLYLIGDPEDPSEVSQKKKVRLRKENGPTRWKSSVNFFL